MRSKARSLNAAFRLPYLIIAVLIFSIGLTAVTSAQSIDPAHLTGLRWRNIGPFRGGRVSAVAGVVTQPDTFYFGLPEGGIWKTTSAGQTWYPVFDSVKDVSTVGSIQVAPSDPNIVYAGTGEMSLGGPGNGVYRSADAGATWRHIGLEHSELVPSLLVDPHDPNFVLAATVGDRSKSDPNRGVYRSTDGGNTWVQTLFISKDVGVQHLAWAYDNPNVVYASSMYTFGVPGMTSTGPNIYKSEDEGNTWKKLSPKGLTKISGRICIAVAQGTNSQRLYLIGTFGLYRSDDGGFNWRKMASDDSRIANGQGYYSCGVYVDPKNPDIVYTIATCVYRSMDGGKTFDGFKGAPGGDDPQQIWISPVDGTHILLGGDQGATVSLDAGKTWGSWYNQPTGQVYHVSTDSQFPYWVYATQQDSGCIGTSSRGNLGAITPMDWLPHPGNEGGYIVVDPLNPKVSFAVGPVGGIIRVTYPSGQWVQVEPSMSPESGLRGGSQMEFSKANPHELLVGCQYLMSTTNSGSSWTKLGPDLTEDLTAKTPQEKQQAQYASISSFSTSSLDRGIIWAATSNGFIKVTKDHGQTWEDVSLPKVRGQNRANPWCIEASNFDRGGAYLGVSLGVGTESKVRLYRTHDFGLTWTEIAKSVTGLSFGLVIRADIKKPGLLFMLTHKDVDVSFDDGDSWQPITLNLPTTQLSDLEVHENDLVLGTFGRGIWILDDISPLRQISMQTVAEAAHLFKPGVAYRLRRNVNGDTPFPPEVPHADNPPLGAIIYYSLATKPTADIKLEILDDKGRVVRHMSSAPIAPYDDPAPPVSTYWPEVRKPMQTDVGLNRINWNIRYDTPTEFNHDVGDVMGAIAGDTPEAIEGPLALPGTYTVRLTVNGKSTTQKFEVKNDPRSLATSRDLRLEHQLRMNLYNGVKECADGYIQISAMRTAVQAIIDSKPVANVVKSANEFAANLDKVSGKIVRIRRFYGPPPPTSFVNLNGYLLTRLDSFDYGDIAPTDYMWAAYGSDWAKLKKVSDAWRNLQKKDLVALNAVLAKNNLKPLTVAGPALVDPPAPDKKYLPPANAPVTPQFGFAGG